MSSPNLRHEASGGGGDQDMGSRARYSSSPELSSPPRSISEPPSPPAQQILREQNNSTAAAASKLGGGDSSPAAGGRSSLASQPQPKERKKPGRKPKPKPVTEGTPTITTDTKPERKKRTTKDPNAPKQTRKKKGAASEINTPEPKSAIPGAKQTKLTDMGVRPAEPIFSFTQEYATNANRSPSGNSEVISTTPVTPQFEANVPVAKPPQPAPPAQQPRTSGQNYDPIRSNYDPVRDRTQNSYSSSSAPPPQSQFQNRASASPSIASLVDPPVQGLNSPSQSYLNQAPRFSYQDGPTSVPPSPVPHVAASPMAKPATLAVKDDEVSAAAAANNIKKAASTPAHSATPSKMPSPKPNKLKDIAKDIAPPPLPGSFGGMGSGPSDGTEFRAPTVILHIPMNGETNKYVNFTKMAEERYGWDALHPRLAAQRDRLARVAAAGAALERNGSKESGDEMSLDLSEGEGSNVEMGGMSDARTGTDGGAKKPVKKRKMKEDEYDKDDGFVDDSELLWEEQAAASKDGFFVYSGPLVPEGEKPTLESMRGEGPPKRGRGRGRGGSTRGTTSTRGGATPTGPGSRGGNVTRKPRITKADRARMEQEKAEREKMGMTASRGGYHGGMPTLASAANLGTTPMVFNN